jgi:hypothetical protein
LSCAQSNIVSRSPKRRTATSPRRPVGVMTTLSMSARSAVAALSG